jgi:hypothetical protein
LVLVVPLVTACALFPSDATEARDVIVEKVDAAQAVIAEQGLLIESLKAELTRIKEEGPYDPETVQKVLTAIEEAVEVKEAAFADAEKYSEALNGLGDGVTWPALIVTLLGQLLGSQVLTRYLPNSFILRKPKGTLGQLA